jgi:hypothetical protein
VADEESGKGAMESIERSCVFERLKLDGLKMKSGQNSHIEASSKATDQAGSMNVTRLQNN